MAEITETTYIEPLSMKSVDIAEVKVAHTPVVERYTKPMDFDRYGKLNNDNRRAIYGLITRRPGLYHSEIGAELGITGGVLAHHLRKLEEGLLIRSRYNGYIKGFFPAEKKEGKKKKSKNEMPPLLTRKQKSVLYIIERGRGISTIQIAKELGKTRQTIIYHTNVLLKLGKIRRREVEGKSLWFLKKR